MRFMMLMIPRAYASAAPGATPTAEAVKAMTKYNEELKKAGALIGLDGLHPPSAGARVSFKGGGPAVTDGPFPEVKGALGGYGIIDVRSREEAVEWARRCPAGADDVIEVRRVHEIGDFPDDVKAGARNARVETVMIAAEKFWPLG